MCSFRPAAPLESGGSGSSTSPSLSNLWAPPPSGLPWSDETHNLCSMFWFYHSISNQLDAPRKPPVFSAQEASDAPNPSAGSFWYKEQQLDVWAFYLTCKGNLFQSLELTLALGHDRRWELECQSTGRWKDLPSDSPLSASAVRVNACIAVNCLPGPKILYLHQGGYVFIYVNLFFSNITKNNMNRSWCVFVLFFVVLSKWQRSKFLL